MNEGALFRIPFLGGGVSLEGERQIAAFLAFCAAHGAPYDGPLIRRLLTEMTSSPEGVFAFADAAGLRLLAVVVDRADNAHHAAILEILGLTGLVSAETFASRVLRPALAFAATGSRKSLQVELPAPPLDAAAAGEIAGAHEVLREAGFERLYETLTLRRCLTQEVRPASPPPYILGSPAWSWQTPSEDDAAELHAGLRTIFEGKAELFISPLPQFRKLLGAPTSRWRVLRDRGVLAGIVHVVAQALPASAAGAGASGEATRGEIRTLGRMPCYRARGLGSALLEEALRSLREAGATVAELSVEARNAPALALYQRAQFGLVTRVPVFARSL